MSQIIICCLLWVIGASYTAATEHLVGGMSFIFRSQGYELLDGGGRLGDLCGWLDISSSAQGAEKRSNSDAHKSCVAGL